MSEFHNLPPVLQPEKLIPRNFGHIGHITGSKMIDSSDSLLSEEDQKKFICCKRDKNDIVIITEKIDGMNAGVVKKNGLLYPVNRKGYDTRLMGQVRAELRQLGEGWAIWVDDHYDLYDSILEEGERLVFEYAEFTHTLEYRFKCDPVFLLAKYDKNNRRLNYAALTELAQKHRIMQPPLLNIGVALPPSIVISQYPNGLIGVKDAIEGIVYSYEHNGEHESCAKFVSNPIMGTVNPTDLGVRRNKIIR